jgi:hypothetical protein
VCVSRVRVPVDAEQGTTGMQRSRAYARASVGERAPYGRWQRLPTRDDVGVNRGNYENAADRSELTLSTVLGGQPLLETAPLAVALTACRQSRKLRPQRVADLAGRHTSELPAGERGVVAQDAFGGGAMQARRALRLPGQRDRDDERQQQYTGDER